MELFALSIQKLAGLYNTNSSVASVVSQASGTSLASNLITDLVLILGAVVLVTIVVSLLVSALRKYTFKVHTIHLWRKRIFLEVSVPKETSEDASKAEGKNDTKELTSIGEQIFLVLSEYSTKGINDWLGRTERVSFEILSIDQKIKFLIVASPRTADIIERVISAVYSKADIRRHEDVDFFKENTVSYVQEMTIANTYELPFRTYRNSEKDPLSTLSNSLTNLEKNESAAIQFIVVPITDTWQHKPRDHATRIQQGQSPATVFKNNKSLAKSFGSVGGAFTSAGGGLLKEVFNQLTNSKRDEDEQDKNKNRDIDLTGQKQAIQLTPQQQEIIKKLEEKASRPG